MDLLVASPLQEITSSVGTLRTAGVVLNTEITNSSGPRALPSGRSVRKYIIVFFNYVFFFDFVLYGRWEGLI